MRSTHTYVTLELSRPAWNEIAEKLKAADYGHAFNGETIDMHGLAVEPEATRKAEPFRYRANPVAVKALRITQVDVVEDGFRGLKLEDGSMYMATPNQIARMEPKVADYLVTQEDGYEYLNPRDVFLHKYSPETA